MYEKKFIAYIQRIVYPNKKAAAIQSIRMADAFNRIGFDTIFFTHDLLEDKSKIFELYGIPDSRLKIKHYNLSKRLVYKNAKTRFLSYNSLVLLNLLNDKTIRTKRKIIFVRSKLESLYWGLIRKYIPKLKDWIFIYEAHEIAGFPRDFFDKYNYYINKHSIKRRLSALSNYDLIITITNQLKSKLEKSLYKNYIKNIPLCSGLRRLEEFRPISLRKSVRTICYAGTICDAYIDRGVDIIFRSAEYLSPEFVFKFVGRINNTSTNCEFLKKISGSGNIKIFKGIPYLQIPNFLDDCDVVIQPASINDTISRQFASPLKLFDYMVRGKAIIAADVSSHREILVDGYNAVLYKYDDPKDLAYKIKLVFYNKELLNKIAYNAWKDSYKYTYLYRAKRIAEEIDSIVRR